VIAALSLVSIAMLALAFAAAAMFMLTVKTSEKDAAHVREETAAQDKEQEGKTETPATDALAGVFVD
jgi:hypothetical protein